jgi:hypothetical protein
MINKIFSFCLAILFCACASDQSDTKISQTMKEFEQNNKIIARYQTSLFTCLADSKYCKELEEKVYIYLLPTGLAKAFRVIVNRKKCNTNHNFAQEIYEEDGTWDANTRPKISVQTIHCETTKLKFETSFIIGDNPPISKLYEFFIEIEDNMQTNSHITEICLSADTLIIGYDEYKQPVYLYKY